MKTLTSTLMAAALSAATLWGLPAVAQATDVQIEVTTSNSPTNGGPFTIGVGAAFQASFRIDGSVSPTGATPTWAEALDGLELTITDVALGVFTVTAQDGRYRQQRGAGQDFMFGGWGGIDGGSFSPLSVTNPLRSTTPFILESITFDFRGATLFPDEQTLPGTLSHLPSFSNFGFLDLTLKFNNADPAVSSVLESTIIRAPAFTMIQVSPVPEPATVSMLLAGMLVLATVARRRA